MAEHNFFITGLTVFALACFVGYYVVWRVTPALHSPVLCSSRHQHQLVRRPLDEDHILLFSWGYESWRKRMLSLP